MKVRYKIAAAAVAAILASPVWAQSANQNLNVTASVAQTCSITTSAVAFGAYDPVGANAATALNVNGAVNLTCTRGSTAVTVTLGLGANASGSTRRMVGGTNGEFLTYELYHPSAATASAACTFPGTQIWGTAGGEIFTPSATWAAGTPFAFNVCGTIAAGQDVAADAYTDTVVATVNF
jgi:spore coat protein U-like protein